MIRIIFEFYQKWVLRNILRGSNIITYNNIRNGPSYSPNIKYVRVKTFKMLQSNMFPKIVMLCPFFSRVCFRKQFICCLGKLYTKRGPNCIWSVVMNERFTFFSKKKKMSLNLELGPKYTHIYVCISNSISCMPLFF